MPERNRVTPYGEIIVSPLRGRWMGNRGCIHRGHEIVRPWNTKRWIICALEFRGWVAPKWMPARWTALFFYDEALAFAAGHRPCALCRRPDYNRYCAAVNIRRADAIDERLHSERLMRKEKRTHTMAWNNLPTGTYVHLDGMPHVVSGNQLRPWSAIHGYGAPRRLPKTGEVAVITPPLSITAILAGYKLQITD
jgi:hypothetical protein